MYVEAGGDAVRTSLIRSGLRDAETRTGYGASVTAYTRFLGPITLGVARNDAGAESAFLTVGYSFLEE